MNFTFQLCAPQQHAPVLLALLVLATVRDIKPFLKKKNKKYPCGEITLCEVNTAAETPRNQHVDLPGGRGDRYRYVLH